MTHNFGNDDDLPRVGYGNPPKHARFPKGKSPNPAGRPKGSTRLNPFEKLMQKKLTVIEGGKRRKLPVEDAVYAQIVKAALAGDRGACRDLLRFREKNPKPKATAGRSTESEKPRIVFMKDSTALLHALGISVEVENERSVLCSWVIEAARERQGWAPLSPEHEKLLEEFGEEGFKRAA
jgi:hypothetical protein